MSHGKAELLVVDNRVDTENDGIGDGDPIYSPDRKHTEYSARNGQQCSVVLDGHRGSGHYLKGSPILCSPDGKHIAYATAKGKKQLVVVDAFGGVGIRRNSKKIDLRAFWCCGISWAERRFALSRQHISVSR